MNSEGRNARGLRRETVMLQGHLEKKHEEVEGLIADIRYERAEWLGRV